MADPMRATAAVQHAPEPAVETRPAPSAEASGARRQKVWALVVTGFFALVSLATYSYNEYYMYLSAYLWFGFIYGMCLQYGRFCFASAFRDLFAVGVPRMVVGIMIATIFFALVSSFVTATGFSTFHASPSGVFSIVAGFVFGVGMVLSGGCASGSLYKTGEGKMAALLVVLSISVTQSSLAALGGPLNALVPASWRASAVAKGLPEALHVEDGWMDAYLAGFVWDHPTRTFAQVLGLKNESLLGAVGGNFLVGVVVPALALLAIAYAVWARKPYRRELRKARGGALEPRLRDDLAGFWRMVLSSRRTAIAGLALGIACGLQMFVIEGLRIKFGVRNAGEILARLGSDFGLSVRGTVFDPGYWYVTTQEAQWVGWAMQKLGWNNMDNIFFGYINGIPNPALNPADWMSLALIGGACVMALLHNEFKLKKPTLDQAGWAIAGGVLMGIGSRLGLGCNVGAFFVRAANGDVGGWLYGVGMIGGAFVGVRFFNWWTERRMRSEMAAFDVQ
jgi:uncharacterized membrane protein YedE/YeeE